MTTSFSNKVQQAKIKKARKNAGISLVEMVVATAVMGVLSATGLTMTLGAVDKAKVASADQQAMDQARACAVSIASDENPTCQIGDTFTSNVQGLGTQAEATVNADSVELTTKAAGN